MSTKLDDVELVQKFVQGELNFIANQNLRLEPVCNSAQLLAKKGDLIATTKLAGQIRAVLVRQSSAYHDLVNRVLTEHHYLPTQVNDRGLTQYEPCAIPAGYAAHYTQVRHLWRAWRTHPPYKSHQAYLIQSNNTWRPVQNIECGQQLFFIHVSGEEKMLCSTDHLCWLSPTDTAPTASPASNTDLEQQLFFYPAYA
jgi:hypothetical protein